MARCFAKVSEEEIEEAYFFQCALVNFKQLSRSGSVKRGGYIPSRLGIYPPLFTSPSGDSCIILAD